VVRCFPNCHYGLETTTVEVLKTPVHDNGYQNSRIEKGNQILKIILVPEQGKRLGSSPCYKKIYNANRKPD